MGFSEVIKNNKKLKDFIHFLIVVKGESRPRLWVKWFVNPFMHKKGKGYKIRRSCRLDVFPFQPFAIGKESVIESFSTINNGVGEIIIGNRTLIGMSNVIIGPVHLGNNIIMAQNIVMSGLNHNFTDPEIPIRDQGVNTALITVEDDCWIGANSVITAGVTVGKHAVVAAGSVVTKNVPPYSVVGGSPAKILKQYNSVSKVWEKPQ